MSWVHITACQASLLSALPDQAFQLNKAFACTSSYLDRKLPKNFGTCTSTYLGTKLPKTSLKLSSATSKYQQSATVCLFGGKGKAEDGNQGSPWNALEKAMGNFKKETSIEDVLKQQIQKQDYFDDGGSGGKRPGGGGGGGDGDGDGFGGAEDESLSGMWNEFVQVILGTIGFVFMYIYIINGEDINAVARDFIRFVFTRQKSIRLRRLMDQWKRFFRRMTEKQYYNPYWLEREIINTPTCYDHPAKYSYIIRALDSLDSPESLDSRSDDDFYE